MLSNEWRWIRTIIKVKAVLLGIFLIYGSSPASYASEPDQGTLIQATTLQTDFEGMAYFNLFPTGKMEEEDFGQAYERVLNTSVRIEVPGHYGSGSIFRITSSHMIIISNKHVLEGWNEDSFVIFMSGRAASAQLLFLSPDYDVGFLKIPVREFTYEELLSFRSVRYEDREEGDLEAGERVFVLDAAGNIQEPRQYEGEVKDPLCYIDSLGSYMIYLWLTGFPGMSGGGIFDGYGNYVGMVTAGTEYDEMAGVPLAIIKEEYKKAAS